MSCTFAAPPGMLLTMRSISSWESVASDSMSGVIISHFSGIRFSGTSWLDPSSAAADSSSSVGVINSARTFTRSPCRLIRSIRIIASRECPPISAPVASRFHLAALHSLELHMRLLRARATPCGPAFHSPSAASPPSAHTPPAPCSQATGRIDENAILPLLWPFRSHSKRCSTPPAVFPRAHPLEQLPPLPARRDGSPVRLRFPPTRYESPESLPDGLPVLNTRYFHRAGSGLGRLSYKDAPSELN